MMDSPPKHRGRQRDKVENDIIKRREKQFRHDQMWGGLQHYYQHWEKNNTKFEEWTSPRYYEDNTKLCSDIRAKKDKEELLIKRREKLKKLLEEDQRSYDIELMVHKSKEQPPVRSKVDDIPTEVLKEVNIGLKIQEDEKRRREAELKLYHQWRQNNPIVRQFESKYRFKDLKLSWLDQQIEKRMQKEKEEEECKRILKTREEQLRREKQKEEEFKIEIEQKRKELKEGLDKQMEELLEKQRVSEGLKEKERKELQRKLELEDLAEKRAQAEKKRREKECALYNIKHHKLRLKQKAAIIEESLLEEREYILRLKHLELDDMLEDELKKIEIKEGITQYLKLINEQQELERHRQKYLDFMFDSEAKSIYDKQVEQWKREELCRRKLIEEVFITLKKQVENNIEKHRQKQLEVLKEREELIRVSEEYDKELERLKEEERKRKIEHKKVLEEDIKVKQARKKHQENLKLKEIDEELERVRKEEERLKKEIMEIQKKQQKPAVRPGSSACRTRRFF